MALTNLPFNLAGNLVATDGVRIRQDSMLNAEIIGGASTHPTLCAGTGAPTFTAAQGSLYLRIDGSSTSTRMYVNTNGTTGWTAVTTAT